ncbi:FadR/GntR family transcriptional regulator [Paenibacillus sp. URB8-2]|uniref:FadR/GntR family transcriptional regulator n=1 Tax=Paenibacillus sp. URB8-2 TaxID=2741301 RepID=UPI0015C24261|nr:FadR/GntR family transcriptional regulator [Paenibacillus sp. URB8-2]BCG57360.1 GntR family transcriptional regulator [Paenibacillus sp. URB8-2]
MPPAEKQNIREYVIQHILERIERGELKSGDKLTNERELSERLGVSRVPLREAISALSTLGILEARQGEGTFISEYNPGAIGKIIRTYRLFDRSLIEEIFEARVLLEADAARLAAVNRTDEDLSTIKEAMFRHEETVRRYSEKEADIATVLECDNEVHLGIAAAAHNNFFLQIIDTVRHAGQSRHIFAEKYTVNPHHFEESVAYHGSIVRAIEQRDCEAAYQAMREHILHIRAALDVDKLKEDFDGKRE